MKKAFLLLSVILVIFSGCKKSENPEEENPLSMKILSHSEFRHTNSSSYSRTDIFEIRSTSKVFIKNPQNFRNVIDLYIPENKYEISHQRSDRNGYTIIFTNQSGEEVSYQYKGE